MEKNINLAPYLAAGGETQAEQHLARLLTQEVGPLVKEIIRYRVRPRPGGRSSPRDFEFDEIYSGVMVKIIQCLRGLRAGGERRPWEDFRGYVSVMATNACNEHFRQQYPERSRLRSSLRYTLTHRSEFALWRDEKQGWLSGLRDWREAEAAPAAELARPKLTAGEAGQCPVGVITSVLTRAGAPVPLDLLVDTVAEVWQVKDDPLSSYDADPWLRETVADTGLSPQTAMEQKHSLRLLWREIGQLPVPQRVALLLNLRDERGRGVLSLLPVTGVASLAEISETLGIPADEFAGMWASLPIDDNAIAARLGVTRPQVIKLRRAARERLARRLNPKPRGAAGPLRAAPAAAGVRGRRPPARPEISSRAA